MNTTKINSASPQTSNDESGQSMSDRKESDIKSKCIATTKHTTSEKLFVGARELVIEHAGDTYRLRLTNQGKLILTK